MNNSEYLIVHKSILPEYYEQVIEVRDLITNKHMSISDACKLKGISRSTYYKYKDFVFYPTKSGGNKASLGIKVSDKKGILSSILTKSYEVGASIVSINQNNPVNDLAYITIIIDTTDLSVTVDELKKLLNGLDGVKSIDIIGVE